MADIYLRFVRTTGCDEALRMEDKNTIVRTYRIILQQFVLQWHVSVRQQAKACGSIQPEGLQGIVGFQAAEARLNDILFVRSANAFLQ